MLKEHLQELEQRCESEMTNIAEAKREIKELDSPDSRDSLEMNSSNGTMEIWPANSTFTSQSVENVHLTSEK